MRVLLADDHAVVRAGIGKALNDLERLDVVGEVGNGTDLLAALARLQPDMLLIDVAMPAFDPLTTIPRIRADYPAMKILVISAYDDDVYVQGLLAAGVHGYHLKDQPLSDLKLAVQRILSGERWISSRLVSKLIGGQPAAPLSPLTPRQREILRLLLEGYDNQSIARQMSLSVKTVENHLTRLYRQLNVQSRLEAVRYASQHPEILAVHGQTVSPDPQPLPEPARLQNQVTVLVVDDNQRYRKQLQRMVGKVCPNAVLFEAANIALAVETARRISPRLALVDVVLGDESGIHCTRRIKSVSPATRVVLISAYPDREFHRSGLEAGAVAFLDKKDLDADVLRQVIDDLVR